MSENNNASSTNEKKQVLFTKAFWWDVLRVVIGILVLSILLGVSLHMINGKFAEMQDELAEDKKKDFGWIVITVGYTVPLVLAASVPVLACVGAKRDAQRKHLIKGLIIAGAAVIIFGMVCPVKIWTMVKQREFCQMLEQRVEDEKDFIYPENAPRMEDVMTEMERSVKWTAKAALGLAVVGAYQGVRYKKLRDGDLDEEIPEDELADDLPDVDWVPGKNETENS